jgi:DNA-binding XRE family transcriptional regulator
MPFCHLRLRAPIPPPRGYPATLKTLADHLRRERLSRGLTQKQAGALLGIAEHTVHNWETGIASPRVHLWPAVIDFLGYDPREKGVTFGRDGSV